MPPAKIRIGCGAGFSDDRIPPGVEIVEKGDLDYLAMECLAERTIARETLDPAPRTPARATPPSCWNAWKRSCRQPLDAA